MTEIPTMFRFRIFYAKNEALRYTGNLDVHRIWERSFRRAKLPLAYTQGFNKQPRINQALPLPLGFTSQAEIIDFWLEQWLTPNDILQVLQTALPAGISIHEIKPVHLNETALQNRIKEAEYLVSFLEAIPLSKLRDDISILLAQPCLIRVRREKEYNLRPLIKDIFSIGMNEDAYPYFYTLLTAQPNATGRPDEIVAALGYEPFLARYKRTKIIFSD